MSSEHWLGRVAQGRHLAQLGLRFARPERVKRCAVTLHGSAGPPQVRELQVQEGEHVWTAESPVQLAAGDFVQFQVDYEDEPPVLVALRLSPEQPVEPRFSIFPAATGMLAEAATGIAALSARERACLATTANIRPTIAAMTLFAPGAPAADGPAFVAALRQQAMKDEAVLHAFFAELEARSHLPVAGPWAQAVRRASFHLDDRLIGRSVCPVGFVPDVSTTPLDDELLIQMGDFIKELLTRHFHGDPALTAWAVESFAVGDLAIRHQSLAKEMDNQGVPDGHFFLKLPELALHMALQPGAGAEFWWTLMPGLLGAAHIFIENCLTPLSPLPADTAAFVFQPRLPFPRDRRIELRQLYADWWRDALKAGAVKAHACEDGLTELVQQAIRWQGHSATPTMKREYATKVRIPRILRGGVRPEFRHFDSTPPAGA